MLCVHVVTHSTNMRLELWLSCSLSWMEPPLKKVSPDPEEKEMKRKDETTPLGVNLLRSQVLYWAAQVRKRLPIGTMLPSF